jgi:hypothetical protein
MAQMVECFPSKCKALNSNPSMTKKIKLKILKIGNVSGFSVIGHRGRGHLKIISGWEVTAHMLFGKSLEFSASICNRRGSDKF